MNKGKYQKNTIRIVEKFTVKPTDVVTVTVECQTICRIIEEVKCVNQLYLTFEQSQLRNKPQIYLRYKVLNAMAKRSVASVTHTNIIIKGEG